MLSVKNCRRILGSSCPLTDEEIEELRNQIRKLAELAFEAIEIDD
jgi:hypothetical protein